MNRPSDAPAETPPHYDPALGAAALARFDGPRQDLSETSLSSRNTDIEASALAAVGVANAATAPAVYARFKSLPATEFKLAHLDDLRDLGFATIYAHNEAQVEGALATDVKVPLSVIEEATLVEKRMQKICEHFFEDDEELGGEIARLRPGTSRRDLANDLIGYARIYELKPDIVATDPKYYVATDLVRARELAGEIYACFSAEMTPKARAAADTLWRSWTLLNLSYDEVKATGRWLERANAKNAELYPSLFAVGRANPGRPKAKAPTGAGKPPEGGDA